MALIKCPECGHQVSDQAKTCPSCGIEIAGKIIRCPDCGEVIFKEQNQCPVCHCSINAAAPTVGDPVSPYTQPQAVEEPAEGYSAPAQQPAAVQPVKHRKSWIALLVAFVIALIVVFLGIYFYQRTQQENELRAYENAIRSSEPAVLQNFLDMYADATQAHRDSIEFRLSELKKVDKDWTNAVLTGTKAELERYMKLYPQSIHCVEAKIKIDSLDWLTAMEENTSEAYKAYLTAHEDGAHYDEALAKHERLEAAKVNVDDKRAISELFATYFTAFAKLDEVNLSMTLPPVLNSFLHKANATKTDVIQYMHRIHEPDIMQMQFILGNDWKIKKEEREDGEFDYEVEFSVDQRLERSDESKERFSSYKVQAKVSPEYKITDFNMRKIVQ